MRLAAPLFVLVGWREKFHPGQRRFEAVLPDRRIDRRKHGVATVDVVTDDVVMVAVSVIDASTVGVWATVVVNAGVSTRTGNAPGSGVVCALGSVGVAPSAAGVGTVANSLRCLLTRSSPVKLATLTK